jgi:uncharacterized protein (TIGR01777 family)
MGIGYGHGNGDAYDCCESILGRVVIDLLTSHEPAQDFLPEVDVESWPIVRAFAAGRMLGSVIMKIIISGASGMVGTSLTADLRAAGHDVTRLVRSSADSSESDSAPWDPERGRLDASVLAGADAVVNLNGRNVGDARWTAGFKDELRSSRLKPTETLVAAIKEASQAPRVLVNASAIGDYGDRVDEELEESSSPGTGFLADLSVAWEEAALAATSETTRVVALRLGMVLGRGGALARMLTPFKLGIGGPIGSGSQWWSWVAMEDVIGAIRFALDHDEVGGPVNVVSPNATRCREFAHTLGRVLGRPSSLPVPAFAARLAFGEMADALLLASARVRPTLLETYGYRFRAPDLDDAIRRALD